MIILSIFPRFLQGKGWDPETVFMENETHPTKVTYIVSEMIDIIHLEKQRKEKC